MAIKLVNERIAEERGPWGGATALDAPPKGTDPGHLPSYRTHRHRLHGEQEGICAGCDTHFPGGTDHPDNLQLPCSGCNRSKGRQDHAWPNGDTAFAPRTVATSLKENVYSAFLDEKTL
ncbi:MAG: hypothetical protein TQ37_05735 [Candidatus Synechococcus spongiarum 15L]|uniref:HNH endonuclease n=3 Tax=Candidatus Synechococcus spongiarum TaxID=431041 RepID=A0A1T1CIB4_9SYNE|nr:hypothetical protein [Candidatus Synechococcus spongiarum]KKZ12305.1 MAG: hypothetical protein TQ37_05735 [Candidatus Synechococcus spongiarum 15L]OOV28375.1 hypothetical protein BV61_06090 [Candidatus Synechococcus spongiarum LMB bulk15M]OOV35409.1 hypothetical protein BV53_03870 [Candidatus Synechococcus spongiarum LMB bulk15N]